MRKITQDEFDSHDCHLTEEDGCETCRLWKEQNEFERIVAFKKFKSEEEYLQWMGLI